MCGDGAAGGFIILLIFILTTSLEQLSVKMPQYAVLLHERIDTLGAALGTIGIDPGDSLNTMVVDTTEVAHSAIDVALGILSNSVAIVFFLFLLFLMLVESRSVATKFQTRLQAGNNLAIQLGNYTRQIQKQYRIQATSNLLSAVALTAGILALPHNMAPFCGGSWHSSWAPSPSRSLLPACQRSPSHLF